MSDLTDLSSVSGDDLTPEQIKGMLAQIDLDIANLVRDGKLSALKYSTSGTGGHGTDRAANLKALLAARDYYSKVLQQFPGWEVSAHDADSE